MFKKIGKFIAVIVFILLAVLVLLMIFFEAPNCQNIASDVKAASKQNLVGRFGLEIVELTNIRQRQDLQPLVVKIIGKISFACSADAYFANGTKQSIHYFWSENDGKYYTGYEPGDL